MLVANHSSVDFGRSAARERLGYDGQAGAIHRDWMGVRIQEIILPRSWFVPDIPEESQEVIAERQRVETAALEQVFGPRWPTLPPQHRQIADALLKEIAPRRVWCRSSEDVVVRLLIGSPPALGPNVPAHDRNRQQGPVAFWANGTPLYGPGRSLYSARRGSLLVRCGYAKPPEPMADRRLKVPQFLKEVEEVADVLQVRVCAYDPWHRRQLSLEEMRLIARSDSGLDRLLMVQVLVRPDESYLRTWGNYFAARDGHPWVNRGHAHYLDSGGAEAEEIFVRLRRLGLAQRHLAKVLNISPSLISLFKQGARRWSETLLRQAATFIAAAESHVVAMVRGHW